MTRLLSLAVVMLLAQLSAAFGQGYQCRTSPVGTSSNNCASEAFVTKSAGQLSTSTFSALPTCGSDNQGLAVFISDSNTGTFNATITAGGGSNLGLAVCNGTTWQFH